MLTTRWRKGEPMLEPGHPGRQDHLRHARAAGQRLGQRDRHRGDGVRRQRRGGRLRRASTPRARSPSSSAATRSTPAGARRRGGRGRCAGADRRQRRRRRADGVRRRRRRSRSPRVHRDAGASLVALAKTRRQADREAGRVHRLRLRPDPRLPGPGPGPRRWSTRPQQQRPGQDRRPLLRRPRTATASGYRYDVTLSPSLGLRGAGAAPGHPGRVGHARPGVGRVARAEHRRRAAVADGVGRQHLRQGHDDAGSTGSGRPSAPASATPSGSTTPAGAGLHDLERPAVELVQRRDAPRRLPAVGRDADPHCRSSRATR